MIQSEKKVNFSVLSMHFKNMTNKLQWTAI